MIVAITNVANGLHFLLSLCLYVPVMCIYRKSKEVVRFLVDDIKYPRILQAPRHIQIF